MELFCILGKNHWWENPEHSGHVHPVEEAVQGQHLDELPELAEVCPGADRHPGPGHPWRQGGSHPLRETVSSSAAFRQVGPHQQAHRCQQVFWIGSLVLVFNCHPQGIFDFCRYGGTHRLRFDSKGQGLGMAGRRDIRNILLSQPQIAAVLQFHNSTI